MSYNDNITSDDITSSLSEISNKGFSIIDTMFTDNGWMRIKNDMTWICYTKQGHEMDLFDIKIDKTTIHVSIPIKNSPFQFVTKFNDYFLATEYIEKRFHDFNLSE